MTAEPFEISYLGVSVKVKPIVGLDMSYRISLPTRNTIIQMAKDEDHWEEIPGGRTEIAKEIGSLIEAKFL